MKNTETSDEIPKKKKWYKRKTILIPIIVALIGFSGVIINGYIQSKKTNEKAITVNANNNVNSSIIGQIQNQNNFYTQIDSTPKNEAIKLEMALNRDKEYEGIFVTPKEIIIPAKSSRDVPIVITNNYPYPIFMVQLDFTVKDGDLDLTKDFQLLPLIGGGVGIWQPKYFMNPIAEILNRTSENFIVKINGNNYEKSSKIKLSIASYSKEPAPNFTMEIKDSIPKTIKLPNGFIPKIYKN